MRTDYKQLNYLDKTLRELLGWLEKETGLEFTETSSYREGAGSVHNTMPCRGYDLRMRNKEVGDAICELVNKYCIYDHERLYKRCAIIHGEGSNMHIHLQTHPNTRINHG
jgi:hypothetical protein|tara:strand:- start:360 stop:689 length:330 start_codon:yes stop_codon:yes gene_type:complete